MTEQTATQAAATEAAWRHRAADPTPPDPTHDPGVVIFPVDPGRR